MLLSGYKAQRQIEQKDVAINVNVQAINAAVFVGIEHLGLSQVLRSARAPVPGGSTSAMHFISLVHTREGGLDVTCAKYAAARSGPVNAKLLASC